MKKIYEILGIIILVIFVLTGCSRKVMPPAPYGALPSGRQLNWHKLESYAFLHFTTNTFTDKEWGYGDESPAIFNPTGFNADQIISTLARAGCKGAIITAKHHDGFCLWPSAYTEHSVKNSPWKNGKGDIVQEIADACRKYNLKLGIYLSPWDRNFAGYGSPEYITYYRNQLKELLTNYGEIFEVWFDGANGGDGYYDGAREKRIIDRSTYYEWEKTIALVRNLQPNAVIFSDAGPDTRWVGNEKGYASDSSWATYTPLPDKGFTKAYAGTTQSKTGETGTMNGHYWMPAEADVSIRPGWFYHQSEDGKVKSLDKLVDIYFNSIGNGASLNLNIPPDRTGRINPIDSTRLMEWKAYLDKAFSHDLLKDSKVSASNIRGKGFEASKLVDGDATTYWATDDKVKSAVINIMPGGPTMVNCLLLQEYIPLGQRVNQFSIDVLENKQWKEVARGATIGYKKLIRFKNVSAEGIRIHVSSAGPGLMLSNIQAFELPATGTKKNEGQ